MSESPRLISEDELHAYVDNQLDVVARAAVDLYLYKHPDEARRVAAYQSPSRKFIKDYKVF
jgi:anti-sigma factor RsiW